MSFDFDASYSEPRVTVRTAILAGKSVNIFEVRIAYFRDRLKQEFKGVSRMALGRGSTWKEALEDFEAKLEGLSLQPLEIEKRDFLE